MRVAAPAPQKHSQPLAVMAGDLLEQRPKRGLYPPGETGFSLARTKRFGEDPGGVLLECYERFGPVFTLRLFHRLNVFMIGPAANHYITVAGASNFTIRESNLRDFVALVGDGILTTDGEYHRRARGMVLPAFHQERLASYFDIMIEETERALAGVAPGRSFDFHLWSRNLVRRIVMRALFTLDPDGERMRAIGFAEMFEQIRGLSPLASALHPPLSSWSRLMKFMRKLDRGIYEEIAERRRAGGSSDILGLLVEARDEAGDPLTDLQIRDQVMTLLLSALETTASGLTLLIYELARHPDVADRVAADLEANLEDGYPRVAQLVGGELVELEQAIDETLRVHPAVWIGARRATEAFEFEGVSVPAGAYVNYSSLATHYLPDLFPDPERFDPQRFAPEAKAALPKGAYAPFGGGSRKCIGMRFAQMEIRAAAALLLRRFRFELPADFSLTLAALPMLMPQGGVPVILSERAARREYAPAVSG